MKTYDQENEDQEILDTVENEMFAALISEIEGRCQTAKFNFEKTVIDGFEEEQIVYKIEMPSGRYKRSIRIYGYNAALRISQIDFENYILFHEYTGICSYTKGVIEVGIQAPNRMPSRTLRRRLFGNDVQPEDELCAIIEQPTELGNISISIGEPSKEFLALNDLSKTRNLKLTFKIVGLSCTVAARDF